MITVTKTPQYETKLFCEVYDNAEDFLTDYKESGVYASSELNRITDEDTNLLFFLLYAQYANSPVANYDLTQFKYKLWSTIFKYGPSWEKRLNIQSDLRALTASQITQGLSISRSSSNTATSEGSSNDSSNITSSGTDTTTGTSIGNHAYNPSGSPTTQTTTELDYIDQQNVNKDNKSGTTTETGTTTNTGSTNRTESNTGSNSETHTLATLDAYAQLWELLDTDVTGEFINRFKPCFKKFVMPERPLLYVTEESEDEE